MHRPDLGACNPGASPAGTTMRRPDGGGGKHNNIGLGRHAKTQTERAGNHCAAAKPGSAASMRRPDRSNGNHSAASQESAATLAQPMRGTGTHSTGKHRAANPERRLVHDGRWPLASAPAIATLAAAPALAALAATASTGAETKGTQFERGEADKHMRKGMEQNKDIRANNSR